MTTTDPKSVDLAPATNAFLPFVPILLEMTEEYRCEGAPEFAMRQSFIWTDELNGKRMLTVNMAARPIPLKDGYSLLLAFTGEKADDFRQAFQSVLIDETMRALAEDNWQLVNFNAQKENEPETSSAGIRFIVRREEKITGMPV